MNEYDPHDRAEDAPPPPPGAPPHAGAPAPAAPARRAASSGVWIALALILAGSVLLAARFVPGVSLWTLWPLIIVFAGVIQAVTPGSGGWSVHRLFDGLVTVSVGLVFLAITLGVVGWGVWWSILTLWPVLLIAIGLDILGKSLGSTWVRVLGSLAVIAALAYGVAGNVNDIDDAFTAGRSGLEEFEFTESARDVDTASLELRAGVADVDVRSGRRLFVATGVSPWGTPRFERSDSGRSAELELVVGEGDGPVTVPGRPNARADVELSDQVLWDLDIETGLSTLRADLQDVAVRSIVVKPGMADARIRLGAAPSGSDEGSVSVKAGVSSVRIEAPEDAEVRIVGRGGLSAMDVDGNLRSLGGGRWETADFSQARSAGRPVWIITVESGLGSFSFDTY